MPTYEYACTECGERLEVVQGFSDDPLTVCPACQGKLRKLFSPVGVVFKGSGFYKTDSRGKQKTATAASSADTGTTTTDSKPATTTTGSDAPASTTSDASKPPAPAPAAKSGSTGGDSKVA